LRVSISLVYRSISRKVLPESIKKQHYF